MPMYTPKDLARARALGQVTGNSVAFDDWLVSSKGAGFDLFREPHHTDEDIEQAKRWLRNNRDVVTLRVYLPEK